MTKGSITSTSLTDVEIITTSDDAGYKWVDVTVDLDDPDAARLIGEAVIAKIRWTEQWANARTTLEVTPDQSAKDLRRIAAKGHDCFLDENEVVHMDGEEIWTTCRICGDTISAG